MRRFNNTEEEKIAEQKGALIGFTIGAVSTLFLSAILMRRKITSSYLDGFVQGRTETDEEIHLLMEVIEDSGLLDNFIEEAQKRWRNRH